MSLFESFKSSEKAIELFKTTVQIGDVYYVELSKEEGIHPKDGYSTRNKYYVVLGIDDDCIYGGIVFNSEINRNLTHQIEEYQIIISADKYPFIKHKSYLDCTKIFPAPPERLMYSEKVGSIDTIDLCYAKEKINRAPSISAAIRKKYHFK